MNSLVLYAPQIIFFIIFAVIVIFSIYQSKKRKAIINDIKNYAKKNNYKLIETYNKVEPLDLFALITNPSSIIKNINLPQNQTISVINNHSILMQGYIENIIIKEEDNCTVYWGDHTYTTGSGKSKHTHHCFFIAIECNELQFPSFFVRDENAILDYLGKIFGGQDINFSDDYDFSPKFVLQGDSEGEIRKFFNSRKRGRKSLFS